MATKTSFYEQPIDRTPYGSCAWVGLIVIAIIIGGTVAIWRLGDSIPRKINLPNINTSIDSKDIQTEDIRARINSELDKQKEAAASAATDAVKEEAKKQAESAARDWKDQYLP